MCSLAHGQPNLKPVSSVPLDGWVMDLWGYVSPDGVEYALVGHDDTLPGHVFNVIKLADPGNPELFAHAFAELVCLDPANQTRNAQFDKRNKRAPLERALSVVA